MSSILNKAGKTLLKSVAGYPKDNILALTVNTTDAHN